MSLRSRGTCGKCHRQEIIDQPYPNGLCTTCINSGLFAMMDDVRRSHPPREQYLDIPIAEATEALLAQEHVEVLGVQDEGYLSLKIKHWAKKPYKVTRAPG